LEFRINDTTPGVSTGTITLGSWHHIVATYDVNGETSKQMKYYIDGDLDSEVSYSTVINTNTDKVLVGKYWVAGVFFDGSIDEAKVYNRALEPEEITKNYKHGKSKHS